MHLNSRILLMVLVVAALYLTAGCATAPHPLLRALAPSNIGKTVFPDGSIKGEIKVGVRSPFLMLVPDSLRAAAQERAMRQEWKPEPSRRAK